MKNPAERKKSYTVPNVCVTAVTRKDTMLWYFKAKAARFSNFLNQTGMRARCMTTNAQWKHKDKSRRDFADFIVNMFCPVPEESARVSEHTETWQIPFRNRQRVAESTRGAP
jgi:hypothetical protein